jgi:hypothetical protein
MSTESNATGQKPKVPLTPEQLEMKRERQRRYHERHRAERNAKCREYYRNHKGEYAERGKKFAAEHPETILESKRKWRLFHADEYNAYHREYQARWRENHREECRERYRTVSAARRAGIGRSERHALKLIALGIKPDGASA